MFSDGFRLNIAGAIANPSLQEMTLTIVADGGDTWIRPVTLVISDGFNASGTVRLDGNALAGATVRYSGTITGLAGEVGLQTGSVVTAADGTYTAVAGWPYTLDALFAGATPTAPVSQRSTNRAARTLPLPPPRLPARSATA